MHSLRAMRGTRSARPRGLGGLKPCARCAGKSMAEIGNRKERLRDYASFPKISIYRAQRSQQGCSLSLGMLRLAEPPTGRARLRSSLKSPRNPITPFETSRVATLHPGVYKGLRKDVRRGIGARCAGTPSTACGRSPSLEEGGLGVSPVKAFGLAVDCI